MILRTCARCGAEYEWGVHIAGFGEKAQWTTDQIRSSVHGRADDLCWTHEDALVVRMADELHDTNTVSESTWAQAAEHFSAEALIELVMLAGFYHSVSFLVNACGIQHESLAPRFPSAG
jgi:4-carboxymuconolactone decarboxylase